MSSATSRGIRLAQTSRKRPGSFTAHIFIASGRMSDQAIAEGQAALEPIKGNAKKTIDDWLATGAALLVLRAQAMAETKSNSTFGPRYQAPINRLLSSHGLQDIDSHERRLARRRPEGLRNVGLVLLILGHKNGALQFPALIFKT